MQKVELAPEAAQLEFVIEKTTSQMESTGVCVLKIYFSMINLANHEVRIINLNAEKFDVWISQAPLTVGIRPGVDLTVKDSLLDSGKYYDLKPGKQQSLVGTLNVSRWERIPTNKTVGSYNLTFTIALDYYGIYQKKHCLLRVAIPTMFYFYFGEELASAGGELVCINEKNLHAMRERNVHNPESLRLLDRIQNHLAEMKNSAYLLSESEKEAQAEQQNKFQTNLEIIKKMRASSVVVNQLQINGNVSESNLVLGDNNTLVNSKGE